MFLSGRKIQVYSPESLSDNSQCSPNVDADYIFPGPFASFLEEDLNGLSNLEDISSPLFSDYLPDLPNSHNDAFEPPAEPLQIIEDSVLDAVEGSDIVDISTTGETFSSRNRQGDQERRRFSASELISRLQLSQRKNSFTMKLGKSLSARMASRDRQVSNSVGPNSECKYTTILTLCTTFLSVSSSVSRPSPLREKWWKIDAWMEGSLLSCSNDTKHAFELCKQKYKQKKREEKQGLPKYLRIFSCIFFKLALRSLRALQHFRILKISTP